MNYAREALGHKIPGRGRYLPRKGDIACGLDGQRPNAGFSGTDVRGAGAAGRDKLRPPNRWSLAGYVFDKAFEEPDQTFLHLLVYKLAIFVEDFARPGHQHPAAGPGLRSQGL